MTDIMNEIKDELCNHIDNLRDLFEDHDFNTKDGHSSGDLDGVDGFELVAVQDGEVLSFGDFKKTIKFDFFTNDDDVKISDFDWDDLESSYDTVVESYTAYRELRENIEENLTGDQTLDSVDIMDKEDIMDRLLTHMIDEGLVYEINHPEKGILYIANSVLENKIKE